MKYYLIDASAYIYTVQNLELTKINFFSEKTNQEAFLYLPQFCVTEVLNAFARFYFKEKTIQANTYTEWRNDFIKSIRNRSLFYIYDLHRYHNLNADKIYRIEQTTPLSQKEHYLTSFDILIIAMAMELKKIHYPNPVMILSRDGRLIRIAKLVNVDAIWLE